MDGIVQTSKLLEDEGKVLVSTYYDNSEVLAANAAARAAAPEFGRYKGRTLVQVGRIDEGDIIRLRNIGYNLLSPDPDEVKRALLYIQSNEPAMLTVPGKPIAKKKLTWV